MKRFVAFFLAIMLCAVFALGLCESEQLTVPHAVTDGNAMAITFELPLREETLYYTLEKIYVNGMEATQTRSKGRTEGWLDAPVSLTAMLDISDIPRMESYTVAASFSVLRPEQPIIIVESQITDNFDTYQSNIIQYNNDGNIVATKEGDILLAPGTYEEEWLLSAKLIETGKMSLLETLPIVFTLPMGDMELKQGAGTLSMGDWDIRARKAEATEMSIAVIIDEVFPENFTLAQVTDAMRSLTVTDEAGRKDFYSGSSSDTSEPIRLMDGTWVVTFKWTTQSVKNIPNQLRLTPYTYDAMMNTVEDPEHSLYIPLQ